MKIFIIFFILLIVLIKLNVFEPFVEACQDNIGDLAYLEHMIPHHQVAVDISLVLQKTSKSPNMQAILRKLIWTQSYEIEMMKNMHKYLTKSMTNSNLKMKRIYKSTVSDFIKPNKLGLTNTYCDPHFFDPKAHMKHLEHMKIDEINYIKHMIPHHQVAVDMSKKLLKYTKNDFMIMLSYRIIRSQQDEIIMLNDLLKKNNYFMKSEHIV